MTTLWLTLSMNGSLTTAGGLSTEPSSFQDVLRMCVNMFAHDKAVSVAFRRTKYGTDVFASVRHIIHTITLCHYEINLYLLSLNFWQNINKSHFSVCYKNDFYGLSRVLYNILVRPAMVVLGHVLGSQLGRVLSCTN